MGKVVSLEQLADEVTLTSTREDWAENLERCLTAHLWDGDTIEIHTPVGDLVITRESGVQVLQH